MTFKEIIITYVEQIIDDTNSGAILHDLEDFYEVKGMVRLAYVYNIINRSERDEFNADLNKALKYVKELTKKEKI